jgi:hypothetical protein
MHPPINQVFLLCLKQLLTVGRRCPGDQTMPNRRINREKLTVATSKSYPISLVSTLEWSGIALNVSQVVALDRRSTCQAST